MFRLYRYVGPADIARRAALSPPGQVISSSEDLRRWLGQTGRGARRLVATFVVDSVGRLLLADRHSEHVACAGGQPVRAAGEMGFLIEQDKAHIESISNQSTGYCPEPDSFAAVALALERAGLEPPPGYEPALVYRRCPGCSGINIVKDGVFECSVCEAELPAVWNFGGE